jgi:hypothetical protein
VLFFVRCHPLQAIYCWPYVIESRLNDLNYIVNTPTRGKKKQKCQMTTQGFSKEHRLTVDASDVVVGAVLLQEGKDDIYLPNCYFSLKFDKIRKKSSTITEYNGFLYCYL